MYNIIAKSYNELYEEEQLKKLKIISTILKIKKDDNLLDLGAGTGISTNYFDCISYGIEPSINMIKNGKGNLINASAEQLPFKSNVFDVVISVTSFHNFSNFDKAISEIKRVAKNKSRILITVLKKSKKVKLIEKKLITNFNLIKIEEEQDLIFYTK